MNAPKLVFGQPIPQELLRIHGLYRQQRGPSGGKVRKSYAMKDTRNPCLRMWGNGPDGAICKNCIHLYGTGGNKKFFKCQMRGKATSGPGTDHYANWPACGKFQREEKV